MLRSRTATFAALFSFAAGALAALPAAGQVPASVAPVVATAPAAFAVTLPLRDGAGLDALLAALQNPTSPQYHKFLSQEEFARRFGPSAAAKAAIANELQGAGFDVSVGSQSVFARGPQAAAERYFGTGLVLTTPAQATRSVLTPVVPLHYSQLLTAQHASVIGLDGLPDWHTNAVFGKPDRAGPLNLNGPNGPYSPPALRQAYSYPSYQVATGAGTSIGIISTSPVSTGDVDEFVHATGNYGPGKTYPKIVEFPIHGGGPYNPTGDATGEATLDVEYSLGSAPGAQIAVFNVPELTDADLLEGYSAAVGAHPDILSTSLSGECEKSYDNAAGLRYLAALHNVFAEGSSEGMTFVAASGDNAAFECGVGTSSTNVGVLLPADDPLVIGVGGTTDLRTTYAPGSYDSAYVSESSFDSPYSGHGGSLWGSCGGFSVLFAQPAYQKGFVAGNSRGVPDLAMHMGGPASGMSKDYIIVGGGVATVEGTSAAAPEFAGLLALRVQLANNRLGDIHSLLYDLAKGRGAFRTGIPGNNGYPTSNTLWDPVLGLGTPYGRVIDGLPTAPLAGLPLSPSNP